MLIALFTSIADAQQPVSKPDQLKAVFLWRLAQFVQWPPDAFTSADSPVVIGVLGTNPFGSALDIAVRGETAHKRNIVVRHFNSVESVQNCHILYIAESDGQRLASIIAALRGRSILTVGDAELFLRYGGMVRFITEGEKVNLRIDLAAVKAERLSMDARLLRIAEVTRAR